MDSITLFVTGSKAFGDLKQLIGNLADSGYARTAQNLQMRLKGERITLKRISKNLW